MTYGADKDICILTRNQAIGNALVDDPRPYWDAMPIMRPSRYPDMDDCWYLESDFYLRIGEFIYLIEKSFDFDGASIPKSVWGIIGHPMQMWILLAALFHDGMYASNLIPQSDADWLFLEIIQACDRATKINSSWAGSRLAQEYSRWQRRNDCFIAVKAFGRFVYPKSDVEIAKYRSLVSVKTIPIVPLLV